MMCFFFIFPAGRASRLPKDVQRVKEEIGRDAKDDDDAEVDRGDRRRFEAVAGHHQLRVAAERGLRGGVDVDDDVTDERRVNSPRRPAQQRGAGGEVGQRLRRRLPVG